MTEDAAVHATIAEMDRTGDMSVTWDGANYIAECRLDGWRSAPVQTENIALSAAAAHVRSRRYLTDPS